jgi:hypothetical protein
LFIAARNRRGPKKPSLGIGSDPLEPPLVGPSCIDFPTGTEVGVTKRSFNAIDPLVALTKMGDRLRGVSLAREASQ